MNPPRKPPPPEVAEALEALRRRIRRAGLTQEDVGRRLGWTGDYVRQLLAAKIGLQYQHVTKLLEALAVHPVEFFEELYGPPPGRPAYPSTEDLARHPSVQLVRWSGLRVLIWELMEKGIFTAEEAERLLEKLQQVPPPLTE